mgnify:FL=1
MRVKRALILAGTVLMLGQSAAIAGDVTIVEVKATSSSVGGFDFEVSLLHDDTGWTHYADRWEVVSVDGKQYFGERVLFHPHVNEQPFTRSLRSVVIPEGVKEVMVRAHDKEHGWAKETATVALPGR